MFGFGQIFEIFDRNWISTQSTKNHWNWTKTVYSVVHYNKITHFSKTPSVECTCNPLGTKDNTFCSKTDGQCVCKEGFEGLQCDQCKEGYFKNKDNICHGKKKSHYLLLFLLFFRKSHGSNTNYIANSKLNLSENDKEFNLMHIEIALNMQAEWLN